MEYDSALAFGDVYALHELWVSLGFREVVRSALRSSRREFDAESLMRAMVFNRLCAPDSKLGCLEWLQTVAIPGMPEKVDHDQLLRTMDALMDRADKVEAGVARLLRPMLDQQLLEIPVHGRPPFRGMRGQDSGPCEATVPDHGRPVRRSLEGGSSSRAFACGVFPCLKRGCSCDRFENCCGCTMRKG